MKGPAIDSVCELVRARLRAEGDPVFTSCGILLLEGLGGLDGVSGEERAGWRVFFLDRQRPDTGLFEREAGQGPVDLASDDARLAVRDTWFALHALDALGARPAHPLRCTDGLGEPEAWLSALDWSRVDVQSERVAGVLLMLVHRAEVEGESAAASVCHRILDWLDAAQDPWKGFWGTRPGIPLRDAILATHRFLGVYEYVHRPLMRARKIVDTLLGLPREDRSLVGMLGSSGWEDLAMVDLLATFGGQYRYRGDEIERTLRATRLSLLESGGDDLMAALAGSSLEHAWLAAQTLAAIDRRYPDEARGEPAWRFRRWPAPGYHRAPGRLNPGERDVLPLWQRPIARADGPAPGEGVALSVVMPCYNLGRYLPEAVGSVFAQTFKDLEIVVVDDGSTDELTQAVLDGLDHPRIRVIRQPNGGLAAARNHGIRAAVGRYICCLDPDDRLRPEFFERACSILEVRQDVGYVAGKIEFFDEISGVSGGGTCEFPMLLVSNQSVEPAVFRRSGWESVGGYCETFSSSGIEDWDLWIGLLEAGYRAEVLPEVVWEYRIRIDQMSEGMYKPERWRRLTSELAERHPASYALHLAEVVGGLGAKWADIRDWAENREQARAWWERNAASWELVAGERGVEAVWWRKRAEKAEGEVEHLRTVVEEKEAALERTRGEVGEREQELGRWREAAEERERELGRWRGSAWGRMAARWERLKR